MDKQFKEGRKYSGELLYGGCGNIDTNFIIVIKRNGQNIAYQKSTGKNLSEIKNAPIETIESWGEYIQDDNDRFFAYTVEG